MPRNDIKITDEKYMARAGDMDPEEVFKQLRERESTPEEDLMIAVAIAAIKSLKKNGAVVGSLLKKKPVEAQRRLSLFDQERLDDLDWFFGDHEGNWGLYSFENICETFHIDIEAMRKSLEHLGDIK
jgi:hypothetical protein